jgi:nucleotide-binding universal stress UspA family protein
MRVLLATDGSDSAAAALEFLAGFPFPAGSEAIVLSVIDNRSFPLDDEFGDAFGIDLQETREVQQGETERLLAATGQRLREAGWAGATQIRNGDPAEEIIQAAEEQDVDLVVLGSHGTTGIGRFLLGSVSDRVLSHAPCSVLIVRAPAAPQPAAAAGRDRWRILLAHDSSEASAKALSLCASLPLDDTAEVTAVRVMPLVTGYRQDIQQQLNTIWQQKKQAAGASLEEAVQALRWSTPHVAAELREAEDVSAEILDMAEQSGTDLIMLGCKGRSAIQRFLLGSKTNRIARHAQCSVWAVRG